LLEISLEFRSSGTRRYQLLLLLTVATAAATIIVAITVVVALQHKQRCVAARRKENGIRSKMKEGKREMQLSIHKRRPAKDRTTKRCRYDTGLLRSWYRSPGRIPGQDTCQENFAGIEWKKSKCWRREREGPREILQPPRSLLLAFCRYLLPFPFFLRPFLFVFVLSSWSVVKS